MGKEFNPNGETHYRSATAGHAKNAGIVLNRRKCHICGIAKETTGGMLVRGTSRHNPSKYFCAECRPDKETK